MSDVMPLDIRKNRALYRACHRGTREMDLILGAFARHVLPRLDAQALQHFEALLELSDPRLTELIDDQPQKISGEFAYLIQDFVEFARSGRAAGSYF